MCVLASLPWLFFKADFILRLKQEKGYKVSLVDMYNSIDRLTDLADSVHSK